MGNLEELLDSDPWTSDTAHSGIGTATTLPMSDEERAKAKPRPLGFIWDAEGQEQ